MSTESSKRFSEVIREPEWRDESKRFIINAEDGAVPDFSDPVALGEILARLGNESIDYIGWGIFKTVGTEDLSAYTGGYLKFWLFSFETLKVEIEAPAGVKGTLNVGSTGGTWQEISIPLSNFGSIDLSQVYGFFMITSYNAAEFLVDHVRYSEDP